MRGFFIASIVLSAVFWVAPTMGEVSYSEAARQLTGERSKITTCAARLKASGDDKAIKAGKQKYEEAKSEMDAVLVGLTNSLEGNEKVPDFAELEARLKASIEKRMAFCGTFEHLFPDTGGQKNIFVDVMQDTIMPSLQAVATLFNLQPENDAERRTVTTQLKAATWPEFTDIRSMQAP